MSEATNNKRHNINNNPPHIVKSVLVNIAYKVKATTTVKARIKAIITFSS